MLKANNTTPNSLFGISFNAIQEARKERSLANIEAIKT